MRRFVVERTMPDAQLRTPEQWQAYAQRANEAIDALAGRAQWLSSYVTDDKLVCFFIADELATVVEHASFAELACDSVREIRHTIDPTTAHDVHPDTT